MTDGPRNPFLLPPGGAKPAPAEPVVSPQAVPATPTTDRDHYIAVPASVESATHRIPRPSQEPAQQAVHEGSATTARPTVPDPAPEPFAEDTRAASPRRWAIELPDGTRVSLDGPLLLGRDPAAIPDRPDAVLLPVADSGKTVSKTHALLEPDREGVRVRELHSTNGVAIDTVAGREVLVLGGDAVAPSGATVMLGSFAIRIAG